MIVPLGLILLGMSLLYSGWTGKSWTYLVTHPHLSAQAPVDPEPPAGAQGPIEPPAESPPEDGGPVLV